MKRVIFSDTETYENAAEKFIAWMQAGDEGLGFTALSVFGRQILDLEKTLELQNKTILEDIQENIKNKVINGKADGLDCIEQIMCISGLKMLKEEESGVQNEQMV